MTEDDLKKIIAQGKDAEAWLNHPCFKHVLTVLKAEYFREFQSTKFKESQERDELWRQMNAIDRIESKMKRIIRDASNAEKTLLQKLKEKFK